eukprot:scaffold44295_cov48-Prasinocladus_malaysianus.AAC.1
MPLGNQLKMARYPNRIACRFHITVIFTSQIGMQPSGYRKGWKVTERQGEYVVAFVNNYP